MTVPKTASCIYQYRGAIAVAIGVAYLIVAAPAVGQSAPAPSAAKPAAPQQTPDPKAQDPKTQDPKTQGQQAAPQKPEPPPNIPLFPRYRRGLYKDGLGLWVIDGPPQSPPLFTDDPGVPAKGVYEINFTTSADLATSTKTIDVLLVDANYGLLPRIFGRELPLQLKLEGPVTAAKQAGQSYSAGLGAFATGLKAIVYENDDQGIELSVYPQIEFGTGSSFVTKGLVDPGQTFILPVLVSKQFHYLTLVFNGGVEQPIHDPDRGTIGTVSAATGLAIRRHLAVMAEFRLDSPFHTQEKRVGLWNAGGLWSLGHYAVLYGNIGRSIWTSDEEPRVFLGAGLKIVITPDRGR